MSPRWQALLPGLGFAAAAAHYGRAGGAENLLWICNVSCVLLAAGVLAANAVAAWTATIWLVLGLPLWAVDLAAGGGFHAHSLLTHVGGLTAGILAVRRLPPPPRVWPWGIAYGLAVWAVCRAATPPAANVNAAFAPYSNGELFPSYAVYFGVCYGGLSLAFAALEAAFRRFARPR